MLAQTILIAVMLVTLLAGLFFNYRAASDLKAGIGRLDTKLEGVQADLRHFYHLTGKLEGRLDSVERRLAS